MGGGSSGKTKYQGKRIKSGTIAGKGTCGLQGCKKGKLGEIGVVLGAYGKGKKYKAKRKTQDRGKRVGCPKRGGLNGSSSGAGEGQIALETAKIGGAEGGGVVRGKPSWGAVKKGRGM